MKPLDTIYLCSQIFHHKDEKFQCLLMVTLLAIYSAVAEAYHLDSQILHCASLLRIISRVISAHALKIGGFFFTAEPRHRGKLSFLQNRVR